MKKSSLFISAVLTAFVLAVLAGVITAYRSFSGTSQVAVAQAAPLVQTTSAVPVAIQPQQAAQIAAQYLQRNDLYSVESTLLNGTSAYMVTFSSGDLVYVDQQGQVVGYTAAPAARVTTNFPSLLPSSSRTDGEHDGDD
jgi:hypothetical protein